MTNVEKVLILWPILGAIAFIISHRNHISRWNHHNWHYDGWKENLKKYPILLEHFHIPSTRAMLYLMTCVAMMLVGPISLHRVVVDTAEELAVRYKLNLPAAVGFIAAGTLLLAFLLLFSSCSSPEPKITGVLKGRIYGINATTLGVHVAPEKSPLACTQYWKADSVQVYESFIIAFKGGKPKVTVFRSGEVKLR